MRVIFIFLSELILISNVEAAFENKVLSVRAEGMAGAFTAIADDAGAIFYNPAGLSQITLQEISFFHTHPFNLSQLQQDIITFVQPIKRGGRGFSYQQFRASNNYKEALLTFDISTFVGKNLCIGINLKQLYLKIGGYGQTAGFGIDVGGLYKISPKINIGLVGFNLNQPLIDVEKSYNLGLSIRLKENLLIAIDLEKSGRFDSEIRIGQEFWITNNLCIRLGLKKHSVSQPTLGLGILINLSQLDYSCIFHPTLGQTHLFSLTKWF
ncbi:MAG: UPF0164 family protein [bacterium]